MAACDSKQRCMGSLGGPVPGHAMQATELKKIMVPRTCDTRGPQRHQGSIPCSSCCTTCRLLYNN